MAGHSQFKNIMYRKGAQDTKRAKLFSKLGRELTVAAKLGGADPNANSRLRTALLAAREANMPKDTVERAIKKAAGPGGETQYEEIRYEGFGPGGVSVIVEALTDNRNRTASEVRTAFSKNGGSLGETGSVSYLFDRIGEILYLLGLASAESVFEAALDAGAEDVTTGETHHEIQCPQDRFAEVQAALEQKLGPPSKAALIWKPKTRLNVIDPESAKALFKLLDTLDDNDDVQDVWSNEEIPPEILEEI